ncbi:hypothetical protein MYX64_03455 [Nitrospinae bacterium AH_259_B05_G02_I21]|nr:hypothetical protein [Nitrospinae bacterium AH_259_B05_G02_I21]
MIAIEGRRAIDQLLFGAGQTLQGDGALILTKALLENGVGYLGGYPGSPVAHLLDLFAEAYEPILRDMGIYVEMSNNEASAASLLTTSVTHPIRGAVCWKVVGTNVASDSLAHVAAAGVTGGVLIVVGEDYGCTGTTVAERTLPFGLKSGMALLKTMAALKWLRPYSWRRWKEEQLLAIYTEQVEAFLEKSYDLACVVAEAGEMIRGYGGTRRRTEQLFHNYLNEFLSPLVALDERSESGGDYALTLRAVAKAQSVLKPTGAGFEEAVALARTLQAHEHGLSYEELLAMVVDFKGAPAPVAS